MREKGNNKICENSSPSLARWTILQDRSSSPHILCVPRHSISLESDQTRFCNYRQSFTGSYNSWFATLRAISFTNASAWKVVAFVFWVQFSARSGNWKPGFWIQRLRRSWVYDQKLEVKTWWKDTKRMISAKQQGGAPNASHLLPAELIDRCIGSKVWVIMNSESFLQRLDPNHHYILPVHPDPLLHDAQYLYKFNYVHEFHSVYNVHDSRFFSIVMMFMFSNSKQGLQASWSLCIACCYSVVHSFIHSLVRSFIYAINYLRHKDEVLSCTCKSCHTSKRCNRAQQVTNYKAMCRLIVSISIALISIGFDVQIKGSIVGGLKVHALHCIDVHRRFLHGLQGWWQFLHYCDGLVGYVVMMCIVWWYLALRWAIHCCFQPVSFVQISTNRKRQQQSWCHNVTYDTFTNLFIKAVHKNSKDSIVQSLHVKLDCSNYNMMICNASVSL